MNQSVKQNDFLKPVRIYWHNLKQLIIHPKQFYLTRNPSANIEFRLLSCLPPILLAAILTGLIARSIWPGLLYLSVAYVGMSALVVIERYVLLFFEEDRSFAEILDIVATTAPAFVLGWIPQFGLPAVCLLAGFWNWKALSNQFKMEPGSALAGTALPVVLFGGLLLFLAFIASWLSAIGQMFMH